MNIRLDCAHCGDVSVPVESATLHSREDAQRDERHFVVLACPNCGNMYARALGSRETLKELRAAGIRELAWPPELDEPHEGPPISMDDVFDLHNVLGGDV